MLKYVGKMSEKNAKICFEGQNLALPTNKINNFCILRALLVAVDKGDI